MRQQLRRLATSAIVLCVTTGIFLSAKAAPTLTAGEAGKHVGEVATVCGIVASAKHASSTKGQPTFLNLDQSYPNQVFTVLIWGSDRPAFGTPEVTFAGKRICVNGMIELYKGKPEIVARKPAQISIEENNN